jgi:hypothetical protein
MQVVASTGSAALQLEWYAYAASNLGNSLYYMVPFTGLERLSLECSDWP